MISNMDPVKKRGWTHVLAKGKQFMFLSYEQDVNLLEGMGEAELTDANKVYIF